ncbi:MAG: glucokinase [Acidobacteriota bacterium]
MRLIAGDVGGTKTLLRCVEDDGAVSASQRFESGAYGTFDDLLRAFVVTVPGAVDAACFAVAGPVIGSHATVTNLGWSIEVARLSETFFIPRISLVNDFYAVALGVPLLGESDLLSLQKGERDRAAPVGILGAGTGLGEAMLIWQKGVHHVLASEGGHRDFAPQNEEQSRLFLDLHARLGHVSWERVVSGMGLVSIFQFLGGPESTGAEIAERAEAGDPVAVHTFEIFVDAYGAEAGNMALSILARGGIFLAGGVAAKNRRWFTGGHFLEAFHRKGRFRPLMETIPVDLIVNQEVGLIGALEGARRVAHE